MANYLREHLYQLRVYDSSDNLVAVYDDLISLYYRRQVNRPGLLVVTVPADHDLLTYCDDDRLVEVWITYPNAAETGSTWNVTWANEYVGLYRDKQLATDQDGNLYYLIYFPGALEVISRPIIAYPSGVNDRTSWVGQEVCFIVDDLLLYNATVDATVANGRIREPNLPRPLVVGGTIAGTPIIDYRTHQRNLLEVLLELAPLAGFDVDVLRNLSVPGNLIFEYYDGQRGTDRSGQIIFSIDLDNVSRASYGGDRLRERTVAIVGGPGEGISRTFEVRTGANFGIHNDYEVFVDARTATTTEEMETVGDAKLAELQDKARLTCDVHGSLGYVYRRDYGFGDLVTIMVGDVSATRKIDAIDVTFDQGQEAEIRLEFNEP